LVLAEFFHLVIRKGHVPAVKAAGIVNHWSILFQVSSSGRPPPAAGDELGSCRHLLVPGRLTARNDQWCQGNPPMLCLGRT